MSRRPTVPNPALDDYWWNTKTDRPYYYNQYLRVIKSEEDKLHEYLSLEPLMDGKWRQFYHTGYLGSIRIVGYSDELDARYELSDAGVAGRWGYAE